MEVGLFRRGWVTFGEYLTENGASLTDEYWCQKTTVIVVSCGTKNIRSASFSCVTIHASDEQTDRQTDGQTDSNNVRCITCSCTVKTCKKLKKHVFKLL